MADAKKEKKSFSETIEPLLEKISKLPKNQRILAGVGVLLLVVAPVIYFLYLPKYQELDKLQSDYETASQAMEMAKNKANQLKKYQANMKTVEAQFEIAKQALPESEEIPKLLTSISQSGRDVGLEFLLFKPQKEEEKDFYAELPIEMQMTGKYHQAALFFYKVSRLARIVNISEADISGKALKGGRSKTDEKPDMLTIKCKAVTYKFIKAPKTDKK